MRGTIFVHAVSLLITGTAAFAQTADKFHVTAAEKAACTEDAVRLCMATYPDEQKLLSCMKDNRASLSPTCLVAFDAGVKRRHL